MSKVQIIRPSVMVGLCGLSTLDIWTFRLCSLLSFLERFGRRSVALGLGPLDGLGEEARAPILDLLGLVARSPTGSLWSARSRRAGRVLVDLSDVSPNVLAFHDSNAA